jgi:hypothetical protein
MLGGYVRDGGPSLRRRGSRLVPHLQVPKRGLKGNLTQPLSCTNVIEVQGDLDAEIQPKTAPLRGGYRSPLTCLSSVAARGVTTR